MEERVAVGDSVLLIVNSAVGSIVHFEVLRSGAVLDQSGLVAGEGQLVHLSVAGVADTKTKSKRKQHDKPNSGVQKYSVSI